MWNLKNSLVALAWFGALHATLAQAQAPDSVPIPVQSQGGIRYLQGGIGSDEVAAIRAQAAHYNLRLTFANTHGEYLSDVAVHIVSASAATVVALKTEGPLLYLTVPPGRYRISAGTRRNFETRWVDVPAHGSADLTFIWRDRQHPGPDHGRVPCNEAECGLPKADRP